MVKPRRASPGGLCRAASVPHAVGFKQQFGNIPAPLFLSLLGNMITLLKTWKECGTAWRRAFSSLDYEGDEGQASITDTRCDFPASRTRKQQSCGPKTSVFVILREARPQRARRSI